MEEIWKDIHGYEGLYQVSNLGNVRSLHYRAKSKGSKIQNLKQQINKGGYLKVTLLKNGKAKNFFVHRLVACEFIPNPNNKPQINHLDGNKSNNTINNLEWATNSENQTHAILSGLKEKNTIGQMGYKNVYSKPIIQYDLSGNFVNLWYSIADAARSLNGAPAPIVHCAKGRIKRCYNSIWRYLDDDYIPMQITI